MKVLTVKSSVTTVFLFMLIIVMFISYKFISYTNKLNQENMEKVSYRIFNNPNYGHYIASELDYTYYNKYYKKIMEYTLKDYNIASSYKSYLVTGPNNGVGSLNSIKQVLEKGARFINLDVFSDKISNLMTNAKPVVKSMQELPEYSTSLNFDDCCKIIVNNGWLNNNYPLLLYLNLHFGKNNELYDGIAASLMFHFQTRLLDKKYSYNRTNISNAQISDLLDKIIIITNVYPTNNNLNEFINSVIYDNNNDKSPIRKYNYKNNIKFKYTYSNTDDIIYKNKNSLAMVYPINKNDSDLNDPKSELFNINSNDARQYGNQIICMNYQLFDKNMINDIKYFQNNKGGFVLKDEKLREVSQPPEEVKKQDKKLSLKPEKMKFC